jgi:hypothetical protein
MKTQLQKIVCTLLLAFSICPITAQTKPEQKDSGKQQVVIELKDGNNIDGKLLARRGDTVVVESKTLGTLNIHIKNIKSIDARSPENIKANEYWFDNVHAVHGFISPTGFNLRKGEGHFSNIYLFFNYVSYGLTDNFSLTAGTEFLSLLFGEGSNVPSFYYLNPKISIPIQKEITVGLGSMLVFYKNNNLNGRQPLLPIPYGVVTFGNRNNNGSLGFATSFVGSRKIPILTLSAQGRAGRGLSLMTENYFGEDLNFGITGCRFMSKHIGVNVGFFYSLTNSQYGIASDLGTSPLRRLFLGLNVPFGRKRK